MFLNGDFQKFIGQWIEFATASGRYRGMVEAVKGDSVLLKMPKKYANGLTNDTRFTGLDVQLAGCGCAPTPFRCRGPWVWWWVPFIVIIFIFPWFCW